MQYNIHYRIVSVGPDNLRDFGPVFSCWPEAMGKMLPEFVNGLYDSTNGTKSHGDLIATSQKIY